MGRNVKLILNNSSKCRDLFRNSLIILDNLTYEAYSFAGVAFTQWHGFKIMSQSAPWPYLVGGY